MPNTVLLAMGEAFAHACIILTAADDRRRETARQVARDISVHLSDAFVR
jgi:hypothetical protein